MELVAIVFILVAGGAIALFVIGAVAIANREEARGPAPPPPRDSIAASILVQIVVAGGGSLDEATRSVRREAGLAAPITRGIDVGNWSEVYARNATPEQRAQLLEIAVRIVASRGPVPLRQYAALLDLSFGLGFQTDALARLREQYGFEYVDPAKAARPKGADRSGDAAPLFVRTRRVRQELLGVLGFSGEATRPEISAAYRKLVTQHHPDRYHGAPVEEQAAAAARFIEITRAYEELLLMETE